MSVWRDRVGTDGERTGGLSHTTTTTTATTATGCIPASEIDQLNRLSQREDVEREALRILLMNLRECERLLLLLLRHVRVILRLLVREIMIRVQHGIGIVRPCTVPGVHLAFDRLQCRIRPALTIRRCEQIQAHATTATIGHRTLGVLLKPLQGAQDTADTQRSAHVSNWG
jgi:hypothetical protein